MIKAAIKILSKYINITWDCYMNYNIHLMLSLINNNNNNFWEEEYV